MQNETPILNGASSNGPTKLGGLLGLALIAAGSVLVAPHIASVLERTAKARRHRRVQAKIPFPMEVDLAPAYD